MRHLPACTCPRCGQRMASRPFSATKAPRALRYRDCLRSCDGCGIAYSNAQGHPVLIHRDPVDNVPQPVRDEFLATLALALNVGSRTTKYWHAASERSEDAVTWTVFRYLQDSDLLPVVLGELGLTLCSEQPTMLLWGVPIPLSSPSASALRRNLVDVLDRLEEKPTSRSEPDVVLDLGAAGLVIVEVKVHSGPNTKEPNYAHWNTYLDGPPFSGDNAIRKSGFYELARYWRIGCDLAEDRPFALFSLGPADLFARNDLPGRLAAFQKGLATQERHRVFRVVDWPAFLKPAVPPASSWFRDYCCERGIWSPSDSDEEDYLMSQADRVRQYALETFVEPARRARERNVSFSAEQIAKGLRLTERYPNICQAVDGAIFAQQARVRLVERQGPRQSSSVTWTFRVLRDD